MIGSHSSGSFVALTAVTCVYVVEREFEFETA